MSFKRLSIIGCGLMGSSFAKAARQAGIAQHIVGYNKDTIATQEAQDFGILDEAAFSLEAACKNADLILIATPVGVIPQIFTAIAPYIEADALLMDVGSTKLDVIRAAREKLGDKIRQFIPAHPIAGSHASGHRAAMGDLFQYVNIILTPSEETHPSQLQRARQVWESLGSYVQLMTPEEHDQALGAVSHFPHLLAFAYMSHIIAHENADRLFALAGDGFKDFTRIAGSDPTMWRDIFTANKEEMLAQISNFKIILSEYEALLQTDEGMGLRQLVQTASDSRVAWLNSRPIKPPKPAKAFIPNDHNEP